MFGAPVLYTDDVDVVPMKVPTSLISFHRMRK
jgi:hypothetical protein